MSALVLPRARSSLLRAASRTQCSISVCARFGSTAAAKQAPTDPLEIAYPVNVHRSNGQELIAKVPVIEVDGTVALCDGGGGATGHPIEFIKLDQRGGLAPVPCKYCGLRYKGTGHHHAH